MAEEWMLLTKDNNERILGVILFFMHRPAKGICCGVARRPRSEQGRKNLPLLDHVHRPAKGILLRCSAQGEFFKGRRKNENMNVGYELKGKILKVRLPKEIDHHVADGLRREIDRRIEFDGITSLVFDFIQTEFMDSSGIGLVLGRCRMVQYLGGKVMIVNASDKIRTMFRMAGVDGMVTIKGMDHK